MFKKHILPSQQYFFHGGPTAQTPSLDHYEVIGNHIERLTVLHMKQMGADLTPQRLIMESQNETLLSEIKADPIVSEIEQAELDVFMLRVQERAFSLLDEDRRSEEQHRKNTLTTIRRYTFSLIIIVLIFLFGLPWEYMLPGASTPFNQTPIIQSFPEFPPLSFDSPELNQPAPHPSGGILLFGSTQAKKRVDLWGNFTCPGCALAYNALKELTHDGDSISVYYHNLPGNTGLNAILSLYLVSLHEISPTAAQNYIAWVYQNQESLRQHGLRQNDLDWLQTEIPDLQKLKELMKSDAMHKRVKEDVYAAAKHRVTQSPVLMINETVLVGGDDTLLDKIKKALEDYHVHE